MSTESSGVFFRKWLTSTYAKQDNALGDLARETEVDPCWPRTCNERVLHAHLVAHESCSRVLELFAEAYAEYVRLGLRPETARTDEEEMRNRMQQVLRRTPHQDRHHNYASRGNEIWALLPDDIDISGPRSVQEIAEQWAYPKSGRTGSVYFIRAGAGGPIKIGFAGDPAARCRELQTGHPEQLRIVKVLPDRTMTEEKELHARFAHLRMQGEWFRPGLDLLAFIDGTGGEL